MSSAVATSNVTPPGPAGEVSRTSTRAVTRPASPSVTLTSVTDSDGCGGGAPAVTLMSSTPTHSSLPTALAVMMRTCTSGWPSTAAGSTTLTDVSSAGEARSGRRIGDEASRHVGEGPGRADAVLQRDGLHGVVGRMPSMSRSV